MEGYQKLLEAERQYNFFGKLLVLCTTAQRRYLLACMKNKTKKIKDKIEYKTFKAYSDAKCIYIFAKI